MPKYATIAHRVRLVIGAAQYPITMYRVTFVANAVPTASVVIPPGTRDGSGASLQIDISRGDSAAIVISWRDLVPTNDWMRSPQSMTPTEDVTLFRGRVADVLLADASVGSFGILVELRGRLSALENVPLNPSIISASFRDTAADAFFGESDNGNLIRPSECTSNLWTGIRNGLSRVLTPSTGRESIDEFIRDTFGNRNFNEARDILNSMSGNLNWRGGTRPLANAVAQLLNRQLAQDFEVGTALTKLLEFGETCLFSIVELPNAIRVVPFTPVFRSGQGAGDGFNIYPESYGSVGRTANGPALNVDGVVLVDDNDSDGSVFGETAESLVVGYHQLGSATGFGRVITQTVPPVLRAVSDSFITGDLTGPRQIFATGVEIDGRTYDITAIGEDLAAAIAVSVQYSSQQATVTCPFLRTDISPLEAVQVHLPRSQELASAAGDLISIWGSVSSVTIQGNVSNPESPSTSTTYNIAFARSTAEQQRAVNPIAARRGRWHPLFTRNYIGGTLLGGPR